MAWTTPSIKKEPAEYIFVGVQISPVLIGNKTVGWTATMPDGRTFQDVGLTKLCRTLWENK